MADIKLGSVLIAEDGTRFLVAGSQPSSSQFAHYERHYELVQMPIGATAMDFLRTFHREADLESMDVAGEVPS